MMCRSAIDQQGKAKSPCKKIESSKTVHCFQTVAYSSYFLCSKRFLEWVILVGSPRTYPRSTVRAKSPPGGGPFYFEFKPAGIDWS